MRAAKDICSTALEDCSNLLMFARRQTFSKMSELGLEAVIYAMQPKGGYAAGADISVLGPVGYSSDPLKRRKSELDENQMSPG
jgi:hypothetical protein